MARICWSWGPQGQNGNVPGAHKAKTFLPLCAPGTIPQPASPATVNVIVNSCRVRDVLAARRYLPILRPKTNFSVGTLGSVVVPSWALPASLLTAGIAKYWNVMVVWPGCSPGSTSKMEYP